jgi:hypothetical protein
MSDQEFQAKVQAERDAIDNEIEQFLFDCAHRAWPTVDRDKAIRMLDTFRNIITIHGEVMNTLGDINAGCDLERGDEIYRQVKVVKGEGRTIHEHEGDMIRQRLLKTIESLRKAEAELQETKTCLDWTGQVAVALEKSLEKAKDFYERVFEVSGGCDHSVGVCECADRDDYEEICKMLPETKKATTLLWCPKCGAEFEHEGPVPPRILLCPECPSWGLKGVLQRGSPS